MSPQPPAKATTEQRHADQAAITAAIHRVQDKGRVIIREVPTGPEHITYIQCGNCGSTATSGSPGQYRCRLCGGTARKHTWTRPDIHARWEQAWKKRRAATRQPHYPSSSGPATITEWPSKCPLCDGIMMGDEER